MVGKLLEREHPTQHYRTLFDQRNGLFIRKESDGWPEPEWAVDGPELIDLSITNYCERSCLFCYRNTVCHNASFMGLADVEKVVYQAESCGTMQIALGGGNPNQHPYFIDILKMIRQHDIVPSYTSNGDGLTDEVLKATADYCGAMAVSVYPPYSEIEYEKLLKHIAEYGVRVNLHAIIKEDTFDIFMRWMANPPAFFRYVNAVIFLNYKPVKGNLVSLNHDRARVFFETIDNCQAVKIGFDSCSISGIVQWMSIPSCFVEPCEAARFSAFVSENMRMYPCSFMVGNEHGGDLRKDSMLDVWKNNTMFKQYRNNVLQERCLGCKFITVCKGGCRFFDEINFCNVKFNALKIN